MRSSRGVLTRMYRFKCRNFSFQFAASCELHTTLAHIWLFIYRQVDALIVHILVAHFFLLLDSKIIRFFGTNSTRNISSKQQFKLDLLPFAYKSTGFHDTLNCMPFVKSITTHLLYDYVAIEIAIDSNSDNVSANHF